ncbi:MAG TPA: hypothetical protein VIU64_07140, partial [Polyangia bacterium]
MPLNTAFVLTYNGSFTLSTSGIQLRPQGGAPVALEPVSLVGGSSLVVRPQAPLSPQTVYEVLDSYTVPCQATECNGGSPHVVATFTTGDASDLTPPTFGGLASITITPAMVPPLGCISATDYYTFTLRWAPAADPGGADVRYHVYAGSERLASFLSATSIQGSMACLVSAATWLPSSSWAKPLTVRAVDLAGNEDQNQIAMSVDRPSCPRPNDTGVGGAGGSQADAGTIPDAGGGGTRGGGTAGAPDAGATAGTAGMAGAAGGAGGGPPPTPGDTADASAPEMDAPIAAVDAAVPGSGGGAGGSGTITPP